MSSTLYYLIIATMRHYRTARPQVKASVRQYRANPPRPNAAQYNPFSENALLEESAIIINGIFKIFVLLFFLMTTFSCDRQKNKSLPLEQRIENAEYFINKVIVNMQNNASPEIVEYSLPAYKEALHILKGRKFLEKPYIFEAVFHERSDSRGYSPTLRVHWLDADYAVSGLFIIDSDGNRYDFPQAYDYISKEEIHRTVFVMGMVCINLKGGQPWEDQKFLETTICSVITLPAEIFKGDIKVGLITRDGKETNIINAWVSENYLEKTSGEN